ncbi:MAG: NupC/NupG family nucleoside CNT transporter [Gammaproteobacteria bacterium]|nr:MAG: NupC/NupG family nucleoside CNT transporter [Gammaproteobacteria bacterium]
MIFEVLRGIVGIAVILAIAYLFSSHKDKINYRTILLALLLQISFGALVLFVPAGKDLLLSISNGVAGVISFSDEGINFLFGDIGRKNLGFLFAFHVLPIVVFFSSLIAVFYYLGIMSRVINIIGGGLQKLLATSKTESLSAAANIFVGITEAPLVIKPYLPTLTTSQLFAVMVGGMATVAGSVLAGYASLGVELKYLIAASFMAAPAGLLMAKLIIPEIESKEKIESLVATANENITDTPENIIDAAATGAIQGLKLALNIGAVLLAFVSLVAMLNALVAWIGSLFGADALSLQEILGTLFQPIAYLMGVPWNESNLAGSLIGEKIVINEFVAFIDFIAHAKELSPKTQVIVIFALCGFANFGSIAVVIGGMGALAPTRRKELSRLGLKAVLAGALANLLSACIAGIFFTLGQ